MDEYIDEIERDCLSEIIGAHAAALLKEDAKVLVPNPERLKTAQSVCDGIVNLLEQHEAEHTLSVEPSIRQPKNLLIQVTTESLGVFQSNLPQFADLLGKLARFSCFPIDNEKIRMTLEVANVFVEISDSCAG